jgi:hypothetical protein
MTSASASRDRRGDRARSLAGAVVATLLLVVAPKMSKATPPDQALAVAVVGEASDPLKVRVIAELRAAGLRVISTEDGPEPDSGEDAAAWAFAAGATSALVLRQQTSEATVLIVRGARRGLVSRVIPTSGDRGVTALLITEAVRSSLREAEEPAEPLNLPAAAAPAPREAPPELAATPPTGHWGGSLGAGVASGFAGFGPSAAAFATIHWQSKARWGIEALCAAPLSSEAWSGGAGHASVTFGLTTVGVRWEALRTAWGSVDLGASIGPAVALSAGQAAGRYVAIERTTWVVAPALRAGATVRVARSWRARLDVAAAVVVPEVAYTSPVDGPSSWGRPLALAALSLEGIAE